MAVTIRYVNGLREIGGTFVEVETLRTKCMFDFGFSSAHLLDPQIPLGDEMGAARLAAIGILPVTDGIYDARNARALRVLPYGEPAVGKECFFLISHLHIDHMGGLGFLHPDIPVYMTRESLKLYERGIELVGICENRLNEVTARIEAVNKANGTTDPLNISESGV